MATSGIDMEIQPMVVNQNQAQGNKQMYRKAKRTYINILHDPRVVRGNTYAAFVIPSSLQQEFIRLKENEERQKRMMQIPDYLPKVATDYYSKAKQISETQQEDVKEVDSPKYRELNEVDKKEDDLPYYYIDKPPTPKFIPLPPGVECGVQVEDHELFDFDLEVIPILEVLVGRSLVQSRYELIEEDERQEYINHKIEYEQEREFELNNLQRMEAARIRRINELNRRKNQVVEKDKYQITLQKKLFSKVFAKKHLSNLKDLTLKHLEEQGFLKHPQEFDIVKIQEFTNYPQTVSYVSKFNGASNLISSRLELNFKEKFGQVNHNTISKENARVVKMKKDKEEAIKKHLEDEENKHHQRMKRKEEIRIERLTKQINDTVIKSKMTKNDILSLNVPLDIDAFKRKGDNRGLVGELVIVLNEIGIVKSYFNNPNPTHEMTEMIHKFFNYALEQTLNLLKDSQNFELNYIEHVKIDITNTAEDKKVENINFMMEYKRICLKSIKLLVDSGKIHPGVFNLLLKTIADLMFETKRDPLSIVADPENQEPEYLSSIAKQQEEITAHNIRTDKLRAKIKVNLEKVEDIKARRNNITSLIYVHPNRQKDNFNEEEEHNIENPLILQDDVKIAADVTSVVADKSGQDVNLNQPVDEKKVDDVVEDKKDEEKPDDQGGDSHQSPLKENLHDDKPIAIEEFSNIAYVNSVDVFSNREATLDTYVFQEGVTDIYKIKILRKLKKWFDVEHKFNLESQFSQTRDKYSEYSNFVLNKILEEENYKGNKLFKIDVVPPEPDQEEDPNAPKDPQHHQNN